VSRVQCREQSDSSRGYNIPFFHAIAPFWHDHTASKFIGVAAGKANDSHVRTSLSGHGFDRPENIKLGRVMDRCVSEDKIPQRWRERPDRMEGYVADLGDERPNSARQRRYSVLLQE
jgi:hypothetical protein